MAQKWCYAKSWSSIPNSDGKGLLDAFATAVTFGLKLLFYDLGSVKCGSCGFGWDANINKNAVKCPACGTLNKL